MSEIIFLVEEANVGGYQARALDYSIFTDAETMEDLKVNVKEAVQCHFEENEMPKMVRLHSNRGFDCLFTLALNV